MNVTVGSNTSSIMSIMMATSDGGWVSVGPTLKSILADYRCQLDYENNQMRIRYITI